MYLQFIQGLTYPLSPFVTDGRGKPKMGFPSLLLYPSWLKGKSQKVKLNIFGFKWRVVLLVALAVNDIRFLLLDFQFAPLHPQFYRCQYMKCLFEMLAMDDNIIGIAFIGTFGKSFLEPCVKGKMQKYVCQQRRYAPSLWRSFAVSWLDTAIPLLYWRIEPSFYIHQDMFLCSKTFDSPDQ